MKLLILGPLFVFLALFSFVSFNSTKGQDRVAASVIKEIDSLCKHEGNRTKYISCFKESIQPYLSSYETKELLRALREILLTEGAIIGAVGEGGMLCHDITHAIGQATGIVMKDVGEALGECSHLCTSGCYHGVIEVNVASGRELNEIIHSVCQSVPPGKDPVKFRASCYHGLGHGVAEISGNLADSLNLCDLTQSKRDKLDCSAGVFMELYEPGSFEDNTIELPEDITENCKEYSSAYSDMCYMLAGSQEYFRSRSLESSFKACKKISDRELRSQCVTAIGQTLYFYFPGETEKLIELCGSTNAFSKDCVKGILFEVARTDPLGREGFKLCSLLSDDTFGEECRSHLNERLDIEKLE